jgi:RimJ/RimL family protein N-acetyltransferase
MLLREFADVHCPALERDEVKYNLILGLLGRLLATEAMDVRLWTLGAPGACAMQTSPRNAIILGQLTAEQCYEFAEATLGLDYPGVVGVGLTARLFMERAAERGIKFVEPVPQLIHVLRRPPVYPAIRGSARPVGPADADLFADWLIAFFKEATPHDTPPPRQAAEQTAAAGHYRFWTVDGEPVAMAGIVRRTRHTAAIAGVYTPPALRSRGYGAAATAAVADAVFAEGRTAACLYTDLRNPASNRCYAKVGFEPVHRAWHYLRAR